MKTAGIKTLLTFVLSVAIYSLALPDLQDIQENRRTEHNEFLVGLPTAITKALSFEFKGVTADFLMLQAMTFIGKKLLERQELTHADSQYLYRQLQKITEIDERFQDPYFLAEAMLVWQAGMIKEGNQLLLKAAEHRPWDYRPLYYLGFNHFYFLKDSRSAAPFLRQAAQISGAPTYLKGLAARFSLYSGKTETGIVFLEGMLQETADPGIRTYLQKRINALKKIHYLEEKVLTYRDKFDDLPSSLEELVNKGLLEAIPDDPYGGRFILQENGRVYTTSKLVDVE